MADAGTPRRQSLVFLLLYALASAGGAIAYVPFLTIWLPGRMTQLAGAADVQMLGYVTFSGAIAASVGGIGFGWLSDRTGNRRGWILTGLVLTIALLLAVPLSHDIWSLVAMIIAWQLTLNMMLGPLAAWAGDCVPDEQKGLLGGLLAFSPALGGWSGWLVTWPGLVSAEQRLMVIALLVAAAVLPVLLLGRPRSFPDLVAPPVRVAREKRRRLNGPAVRMWLARLLVQIAEAALFAYLYFWFRSIDPGMHDNEKARLFGMALTIAIPIALASGRWADRNDRPFVPLVVAAAVSSLGMVGMALATGLDAAKASYLVFGIATTVFLSLHSSQTLRILPRSDRRGRDLGIFNLTNTVPSLIMPWLTISLVPGFGFDALFLLLAALSAIAVLLLATMPRLR
ncbi:MULTISPECIES: MFS transporter [unclassified Sphingopyxis]|uniref:MFS transporter n=1 Tax=unclassified Sphingopyxis TaxID=2614943 RepID=UPI0006C4006A|nr:MULTISPECIES: MFS transporter [unclassified Sphingopyxis]USI78421.1 MFS transporter [Sphingopyxis sp. USTB-05]GAO79175.1 permeases of the major facilitator superfamily [Sphingopyxis sp. C-1]